jgi:hypothetical protein
VASNDCSRTRPAFRDRLDPSVPLGEPGAFGVDIKHRVPRWTLRRVIVICLLWLLVLLIPVAVLQIVNAG